MIDSETFARLKAIPEKEWLHIFKQLTLYADIKLTKMGFEIRSEKDNVGAADFAQEAIAKVFDGTRAWDFNRFPDILIHLKGVIKSLISSHIKSSIRAAAVVKKTTSSTAVVDEAEALEAANDAKDGEDPEQILISDENWKRLETAFGEDMEGFLIFYDWLDGKPPREIAESYNTDSKNIYNIIKRGKRLLQKILLD